LTLFPISEVPGCPEIDFWSTGGVFLEEIFGGPKVTFSSKPEEKTVRKEVKNGGGHLQTHFYIVRRFSGGVF